VLLRLALSHTLWHAQELDSTAAGGAAVAEREALQRRCAVMAELAAALARMLEFVAARLPAAFLGGGTAAGVDLARLAETAAYVVMQVAAPCRGCE